MSWHNFVYTSLLCQHHFTGCFKANKNSVEGEIIREIGMEEGSDGLVWAEYQCDVWQCQWRCQRLRQCEHFVFATAKANSGPKQTCFLKTGGATPTLKDDVGFVFGPKICRKYCTNMPP